MNFSLYFFSLYLFYALTPNIILYPNNQMKKNEPEEIPISDLTNSVMMVIDSNSKENDFETLSISKNAIVLGKDGIPTTLFLIAGFSEVELPLEIKKNLYKVKLVGYEGIFTQETSREIENCIIPTIYLFNFKKMESLKLRNADLDNLVDLKDLSIKMLTIQNIRYSDGSKLITAL